MQPYGYVEDPRAEPPARSWAWHHLISLSSRSYRRGPEPIVRRGRVSAAAPKPRARQPWARSRNDLVAFALPDSAIARSVPQRRGIHAANLHTGCTTGAGAGRRRVGVTATVDRHPLEVTRPAISPYRSRLAPPGRMPTRCARPGHAAETLARRSHKGARTAPHEPSRTRSAITVRPPITCENTTSPDRPSRALMIPFGLLMRFGFTAHPGFKSPILRHYQRPRRVR
jgi:hypothetical protein